MSQVGGRAGGSGGGGGGGGRWSELLAAARHGGRHVAGGRWSGELVHLGGSGGRGGGGGAGRLFIGGRRAKQIGVRVAVGVARRRTPSDRLGRGQRRDLVHHVLHLVREVGRRYELLHVQLLLLVLLLLLMMVVVMVLQVLVAADRRGGVAVVTAAVGRLDVRA